MQTVNFTVNYKKKSKKYKKSSVLIVLLISFCNFLRGNWVINYRRTRFLHFSANTTLGKDDVANSETNGYWLINDEV